MPVFMSTSLGWFCSGHSYSHGWPGLTWKRKGGGFDRLHVPHLRRRSHLRGRRSVEAVWAVSVVQNDLLRVDGGRSDVAAVGRRDCGSEKRELVRMVSMKGQKIIIEKQRRSLRLAFNAGIISALEMLTELERLRNLEA